MIPCYNSSEPNDRANSHSALTKSAQVGGLNSMAEKHRNVLAPTAQYSQATIDRFLDNVSPEPNTGCWLWLGGSSGYKKFGYGGFLLNGRKVGAHVASVLLHGHEIPEGFTVDHLCRVTCCVNPDHLEPVTNKVNILRGTAPTAINARKTHCNRGHSLSGDNLAKRPEYQRVCRECLKVNRATFRANHPDRVKASQAAWEAKREAEHGKRNR